MIELPLGLGLTHEILRDLLQEHGLAVMQQELRRRPDLWELLLRLTGGASQPIPIPTNPALTPFSTRGNEFLYKNKPFRFVGINVRAAAYFGEPLEETRWGDFGFLEHEIRVAKELFSCKVLRFYAAHINYTVEQIIPRVLRVLDLLERYQMFAIIPLTDGVHSEFGIKDTEQNFRSQNGHTPRYTHEFYAGGYQQHYLPKMQAIVEAIKDHPAIMMLELGNEFLIPFPPYANATPTDRQYENALNFFKTAADAMRGAAPHIPIGTGFVSAWEVFAPDAYGGREFGKNLYAHPTIDAASVHTYQSRSNAHKWGDTGFHLESEMKLQGHPLYIGETGMQFDTEDGGWTARLGAETAHRVSGVLVWGFHAWHTPRAGGDAQVGMNQHNSRMWHHESGNLRFLANNVFR